MSPLSLPVLGGAALVSSPAFWGAMIDGSTTTQAALARYLVSVAICWAVLALIAMLVGPAPSAALQKEQARESEPEPADVRETTATS